jgi:hypothetical protein
VGHTTEKEIDGSTGMTGERRKRKEKKLKDILIKGIDQVIHYHGGSISNALHNLFPDIGFRGFIY